MKILMISGKKVYAAERLQAEAKSLNIGLEVMDLPDLINAKFNIDPMIYDVLYVRNPYLQQSGKYLPDIVALANRFAQSGKKVCDAVIAQGNLGNGKMADYDILQNAGLLIPETEILDLNFTSHLTYPLIAKWTYGFKGHNVFLVHNLAQLKNIAQRFSPGELLIQKLVPAECEYKVITVGYKHLPMVLKFFTSSQGFRINFDKYEVINGAKLPKVVELAERAARVLGRELSKVDILESQGHFYVLEVNRFPGLDSFERLTKFNVAKEFLSYLQNPTNRV